MRICKYLYLQEERIFKFIYYVIFELFNFENT